MTMNQNRNPPADERNRPISPSKPKMADVNRLRN